MTAHTAEPKVSGPKPGPQPDPKGRSENSAFGGGREKVGVVAGRPHRGRGAKATDAIWSQRNPGKEDQRAAQIPRLLLGSDSLDDRSRGGSFRRRSPLARLLHHSGAARRQRHHRLLGRTRSRQCDRGVEGQARDQGAGQARRKMDHAASEGAGARRRDTAASGRHRSRRRASAGRRRSLGRSVGADGRILARHAQNRRRDLLRVDHPARRNRRACLCDGG